MKRTIAKIIAMGVLIAGALLPMGIQKAEALSYYPGYTCYYRDISGSCLSYQTSNPYLPSSSYGTTYNPYGNRMTYPYSTYNPSSIIRPLSRYNTKFYGYEEDDDDNDYLDEDDDGYLQWTERDGRSGTWDWYFDEDDYRVRPYRYQSGDDYDEEYDYDYRGYGNDGRYEYEHTRIICEGRDCDVQNYRY